MSSIPKISEAKITSDLMKGTTYIATDSALWYIYDYDNDFKSKRVDFSTTIEDFLFTLQRLKIIQEGMICVDERITDGNGTDDDRTFDVWYIYNIFIVE